MIHWPDSIHQITLPTPFPVGPVHVYLLEGRPLTLLDTGPRTPEALQALEAGLAERGYRVNDLERIIISHAHADHSGLAATLAERSGAEVLAHPRCAARLSPALSEFRASAESDDQSGGVGNNWRQRWYAYLLTSAGVPPEAQARVAGGFRHVQRHSDTVRVDRLLGEGDTLRLGEVIWEVLHTPGHSADLICLYQPQARLLLGSDHLIKHISSNAVIEPPEREGAERRRPLVKYWANLRRVEEMDISLVLPGHGKPIEDHRSLIERRFVFYRRRLDDIRQVLDSGPQTIWDIVQRLFPRLGAIDIFLAVSEVLGHLDVMEAAGEVKVSTVDGVWFYELTASSGSLLIPHQLG